MYPPAQCGNVHAFFMPLVRADESEQLIERQQERRIVFFPVHIGQRGTDIGRARQFEPETGTDFHRQHIDCSALLRLPHPVAVEAFRRSQVVFFRRPFRPQAFFQCGQDLLGIVKIAAPNDGRILPRLIEDGDGSGIMQADGLFRRLLRALVAPFG